MRNVDLVLCGGAFIFHSRGTLWSIVLETELKKYGALSFENVLRNCCMVSDEGHNYTLEVVMGKDAAQSFSFLFTRVGMKMDYSKPSPCLAVLFVRFLQSHSLLFSFSVFINCAPFPWVLVINCDDKWKYSKINLSSWPSAKSTARALRSLTSLEGGGEAQDLCQSSFHVAPCSAAAVWEGAVFSQKEQKIFIQPRKLKETRRNSCLSGASWMCRGQQELHSWALTEQRWGQSQNCSW